MYIGWLNFWLLLLLISSNKSSTNKNLSSTNVALLTETKFVWLHKWRRGWLSFYDCHKLCFYEYLKIIAAQAKFCSTNVEQTPIWFEEHSGSKFTQVWSSLCSLKTKKKEMFEENHICKFMATLTKWLIKNKSHSVWFTDAFYGSSDKETRCFLCAAAHEKRVTT